MPSRRSFVARSRIAAPAGDVYAWHARPGAFERLTPPWDHIRVLQREGGIEDGGRVLLELRVGPLPLRWTALHRDHVPGEQFVDEQAGGPFAFWRHTHRFAADGTSASWLEDHVEYEPPLGPLGRLADALVIRPRLARTFAYRHAVTKGDIETARRYAGSAMRIAITGSSGLIGSHLVPFLTTAGHEVVRLVRGPARDADAVCWDPRSGALDTQALGDVEAIIHLAGAGIADRRWTEAYKREIRDSRVEATAALARTLASLPRPPSALICASAIGIYGSRGDEILTEASPPGTGFLAEVGVAWERAADAARQAGIRVVHLRIGIVLSPRGGALAKMLPPFLAGLGGRLGSGTQYMSWVSIDDVVGACYHALRTPTLSGPVNVTAPHPVTNADFTATLARVLRRPAMLPVPAVGLRLLFGEMGEALLLQGQRVLPRALLDSGYAFRYPDLEPALRHLLGR